MKHLFKAQLTWKGSTINQNNQQSRNKKNHTILIKGKQDLDISADKAFKGNPNLHNPEDLLLSSIMSCHMMSYLYVCQKHNVELVSYQDNAIATLETYADGSGKIIEVILKPTIEIVNKLQIDLAISLHMEANKLCFIANSCNFPIRHQANVL